MFSVFSSISGFGHFVVFLFCLLAFGALYSSWKKSRNEMVKSFMLMFFFVAVFMLIMGILDYSLVLKSELALEKSFLPGLMFAFAHIFMVLALSFYVRIPFRVLLPETKNLGFLITFAAGMAPVAASFINPIFPTTGAKITLYNVNTLFSALIGIWGIVFIAGFGGAFFLYQAFKAKEHFTRIRSVVLGVGFLFWVVGGLSHDFADTTMFYLFADLLLLSSFALILFGIYIKKFVSFEQ